MLHKGFRIDDYMPTQLLEHLYRDAGQPPKKRWASLLALGTQQTPHAYGVIREALSSEDAQMRRFALEAMARHPQARAAEDTIVAMLFDVDDHVRQTACKICSQLKFERAHDGILQLLKAENPYVRDVALNSLAGLWREHDFDDVFSLYQHDDQRGVRIAAAKTLRKRATEKTWRRLFRHWSVDREPRHRLWSCELASTFGGRADLPAVRPLLRDRNRNVRKAAEASVESLLAG